MNDKTDDMSNLELAIVKLQQEKLNQIEYNLNRSGISDLRSHQLDGIVSDFTDLITDILSDELLKNEN